MYQLYQESLEKKYIRVSQWLCPMAGVPRRRICSERGGRGRWRFQASSPLHLGLFIFSPGRPLIFFYSRTLLLFIYSFNNIHTYLREPDRECGPGWASGGRGRGRVIRPTPRGRRSSSRPGLHAREPEMVTWAQTKPRKLSRLPQCPGSQETTSNVMILCPHA